MNNIFISTTFLKDNSLLKEALSQCKKYEIKGVEIGSNHCYEEDFNYISEFPFQFLVHNYFPIPKESFVLNIASFDEAIRKRSIDHIKKAIDFCKKINAKLYTFHPGFLTDPHGANLSKKNYDFQWDDSQLKLADFEKAKMNMYLALDEVIKYSQLQRIPIAIETEGSLSKKNHLLMQRPDEYEELMEKYDQNDLGLNLNIGHLNLAAKAFDFDPYSFVELIYNYIIAMELSHNNGIEDQHLPLKNKGWYWSLIVDERFKNIYKILEFRNTPINNIINNINLIREKNSELSSSR